MLLMAWGGAESGDAVLIVSLPLALVDVVGGPSRTCYVADKGGGVLVVLSWWEDWWRLNSRERGATGRPGGGGVA